jgi:hypothetical protein
LIGVWEFGKPFAHVISGKFSNPWSNVRGLHDMRADAEETCVEMRKKQAWLAVLQTKARRKPNWFPNGFESNHERIAQTGPFAQLG